jgi:NADH:ubiquinone oxidoreductase subunit K
LSFLVASVVPVYASCIFLSTSIFLSSLSKSALFHLNNNILSVLIDVKLLFSHLTLNFVSLNVDGRFLYPFIAKSFVVILHISHSDVVVNNDGIASNA